MRRGLIEQDMREHGSTIVRTKGKSMEPLLKENVTHVVLRKVDGRLKKGDLALYRRAGGQYVLHRIIKVFPEGYGARGDNTYALEFVAEEQIAGCAVRICRGNRSVDVTDLRYRLYVVFWNGIYPVRWAWQMVLRVLRGGKRWMQRKF